MNQRPAPGTGDPRSIASTGSGAVATGGSVAASAGGIAVAGNVEGDIIVGNNNFKVNTNYGTIVYKQAAPQARLRDAVPQPPRAPRGFIGRSSELAQLGRMIAASDAITVYGPDGAGKSALLRQAAAGDAARAMPHGVVMLEGVDERGEALGLEDVIQRLFDALFESDPPLKVNSTTARTYLSNTRPLVVLDGLNLPSASLSQMPDLFPQGALLIASNRSPSGDATQPMKLGPLPRDDSIQLLAARASLTLEDAARPTLDAMCALLADVPLAIVTAANAIRENNLPLDRARQGLGSAASQSTDPIKAGIERAWALLDSTLSDNERQVLAMAANAPGASIDPEWMRQMMGGTDWVDAAMDRLQALGLLRANSPRLRIDPGLREYLRTGMDEMAAKERMLAFTLSELSERMLDWNFVAGELGNILGLIDWAAAQGRWTQIIQLSRAIDPYLTLHGLWDTWRATLNQVLQAARQSGNRLSEAWALHQLGTHAIGVEQTEQAIDLLRQALDLRRSLGDTIGMAYTQHNLDLLIPPAPPGRGEPGPKPTPASGLSVAVKALIGVALVAAIAVGGFLVVNALNAPQAGFTVDAYLDEITLRRDTRDWAGVVKVISEGGQPPYTYESDFRQIDEATFQVGASNCEHVPFSARVRSADGRTQEVKKLFRPYDCDTIEARPPSAPTLIEPKDGTNFSDRCRTLFVNLTWTLVEDATGGATYTVVLESSSDNQSWSSVESRTEGSNASTFELACETFYRWSVYATDVRGQAGPASEWSYFSIFVKPPVQEGAGQIAFLSNRDHPDGNAPVYLLDPDNLNVTPVNTGLAAENVVLSPDGSRLLIGAVGDAGFVYYIANVDGSGQRQLVVDAEGRARPVWSPDGQRIAFSAQLEGGAGPEMRVFVANADDSGVVQVTQNPEFLHTDPTWSPDSARIAYILRTAGDFGGAGIGVVNSDGTGETTLFQPDTPISIDGSLRWSPDGKRLAFQGGDFSETAFADRRAGIYTVNADGSGLTQLVSVQDPLVYLAHSLGNLAWSPDGAHIAYKDGSTLYVINADGSGQTRPLLAIHDANCRSLVLSPVWLADGKRIAYSTSNEDNLEIHIVQIDGSGDINATNNPAYDNFIYPIAGGGC